MNKSNATKFIRNQASLTLLTKYASHDTLRKNQTYFLKLNIIFSLKVYHFPSGLSYFSKAHLEQTIFRSDVMVSRARFIELGFKELLKIP